MPAHVVETAPSHQQNDADTRCLGEICGYSLFNRVEPRSVGGKPNQFNLRQQFERVKHLFVRMNRPIIPDDVDLLHLLVGLMDLAEQVADASAPNEMIGQLQDLSGAGLKRADHAPLLGWGLLALGHRNGGRCLFTPVARGIRPTLLAHLIDEDRDLLALRTRHRSQHLQQMCFFGSIRRVRAVVVWPPPAQTNAVTPQALPDARQMLEMRQKGKGLLDRVQAPACGRDWPGRRIGRRTQALANLAAFLVKETPDALHHDGDAGSLPDLPGGTR